MDQPRIDVGTSAVAEWMVNEREVRKEREEYVCRGRRQPGANVLDTWCREVTVWRKPKGKRATNDEQGLKRVYVYLCVFRGFQTCVARSTAATGLQAKGIPKTALTDRIQGCRPFTQRT